MPPTAHKHKYNYISLVIHTEKDKNMIINYQKKKKNLQSWQNNQRTSGTQLDRTDWWSSRLQGL